MVKPNSDFFEKMLSIVNVKKNEVVFIDNEKAHVDAANNLGIKSFVYTNGPKLIKDLESIGIKMY